MTGGVSSRRLTNGATATVGSPGSVDWSTRHRFTRSVEANGIRYAYVKELTGQAVEKRKSRKSMLGLQQPPTEPRIMQVWADRV